MNRKNKPVKLESSIIQMPMYIQLREVIRTKIEDEEYAPGQAIPSENALSKQYGLNRMTVRNAINALVNEGLLTSVHGKGVYVIGQKEERTLATKGGFRESVDTKNPQWERKIIQKSCREAGVKYGSIFGIPERNRIYYIKRMYFLNDEPYSIEETYIPEWVAPTLEKIDLSVFEFEDIFAFNQISIKYQNQKLTVGHVNPMDARMLKIQPEVSVLVLDLQNFEKEGRPVEFTRVYTRADKCSFKVEYVRG